METNEHHLLSVIRSIACRQFAGLFVGFHELPDSFILMKYDLFRVYDGSFVLRHNFIAAKGIAKLIINIRRHRLLATKRSVCTSFSLGRSINSSEKIHLSDYFQKLTPHENENVRKTKPERSCLRRLHNFIFPLLLLFSQTTSTEKLNEIPNFSSSFFRAKSWRVFLGTRRMSLPQMS